LSHVFDIEKLNDEIINKIFYFSLFSDEHFEQQGFYYDINYIIKKITKILKNYGNDHVKRNIKLGRALGIINGQFFVGNMINIILGHYLSKSHKKSIKSTKIEGCSIDCFFGHKKLCLEYKRLFATSNVYNYIEEESKKYSKIKSQNVKNTLIIFIIVTKSLEENKIIERAIDGYRNLFDKLQSNEIIPKNIHFYISPFSKESDLNGFIKDLNLRIDNIN
jgi:hypothetical protein